MALFVDTSSYLTWAKEVTYGDDSGLAVTSRYGMMNSVKPDFANNLQYIRGIGAGRAPAQTKAGLYEPKLSCAFKMQNGAFLEHVLGAVSGAGTSISPYSYSASDTPPSLTLECAYNTPTTARTMRMLGSYVKTAKISCRVKEPVVASLDLIGKTTKKGSTYQTITSMTDGVYMFLNGLLESPTGVAIAEVVSTDLTIDTGAEAQPEIGTRFQPGKPKNFEFLGTLRPRIIDGYWMDMFLTGATSATSPSIGTPAAIANMRLKFTDGTRYIYLNYSNVRVNNWKGIGEQGNMAEQEIPIMAEGCTATEVTS